MNRHRKTFTFKTLATIVIASGFVGNVAMAKSMYFNNLDSQCTALIGAGSVRNSAVNCTTCHDTNYNLNSIGTDYLSNNHNVTAATSLTLCTAATPTNAAPVVNAIPDGAGTVGTALPAISVSATNETGQQLTFTATGLPAGVTLTDTNHTDLVATINGTPTATGTFSVKVTATDNGSPALSGSTTFTLTIKDAQPSNAAPVLDLIGNRAYPVAKAFSFNLTATDADLQDTLSFAATGLPAGVSLIDNGDRTATISGTPTTVGVYPVAVTVTDNGGLTDSETFDLKVQDTSPPPVDYTYKLESKARWNQFRKELRFYGEIEPIGYDDDMASARRGGRTCSPYQGNVVSVTNTSGKEIAKSAVNCKGRYEAAVKLQPSDVSCTVNALLQDSNGVAVADVQPETGIRVRGLSARTCRNSRDR